MRQASRLRPVIFGICTAALLHVAAGLATASTLYVEVTGNNSANNTCGANDPCRTINHAISVAGSGDTIQVGAGTFAEGFGIDVETNLTITGLGWLATRVKPGPEASAVNCCTVFTIGPFAHVTVAGMTISGGIGGGAGGILNEGTLTLENVVVSQNRAAFGGAGISNVRFLTMTNVVVDHNEGSAGLMNSHVAAVLDSRITHTYGKGPNSSGVANFAGTLLIDRGLIADNQGDGLDISSASGGDLLCPDTTLTNVTISGNSGGGIKAFGVTQNCTSHLLTLRHVTVATNTSATDAGGLQVGRIIPLVENSIVATNSGPQCAFTAPFPGTDISYSLIGDSSCDALGPGNLIGVDPQLRPLSFATHDPLVNVFHLGATKVHKLKTGSPAIDAAGADFCAPIDQLGTLRPIDGNGDGIALCDMGAYEYRPPVRIEGSQVRTARQER